MNVWYGILICGFLSCALAGSTEKQPFTLEEAALDKLKPKRLSHVWISDNELEYSDALTGDIKILDATTLQSTLFLPKAVLDKYGSVGYNVSADRNFVLIKYDSRIVYRRSTIAKYVVYSMVQRIYYNVSSGEDIQLAMWSPTGNALTYVMNNNLYYIPSITPEMNSQAITKDGIPGVVFNGVNDWVYEEEVISSDVAFWYSPKGDQLVFAKYLDQNVGEVTWMEYGEPGNYFNVYPKLVKERFPKAGTNNPLYEIWWANLKDLKRQKDIINQTSLTPDKEVFYGCTWVNNDKIAIVYANRVQNESHIVTYIPRNSSDSVILSRNENPRGWANTEIPKFAQNPDRELKIKAQPFGSDEYDHLTLITKEGITVLTNGTYEVVDFLDWDREKKVIYYRATEENSPSTINVYRISEAKGSKPYCLNCHIISPEGNKCKHATAMFSKKFTNVIIQCNGPDPRMIYLFRNEHPLKKIPLKVLYRSEELRSALTKKLTPEIVNLTVPIPRAFEAEVRLFFPPGIDKSGKTKYPMLLYVYGGINSKQIYDDFKIDWEYYLTTNLSIIYAVADARNTNNKGKNMLYDGYMQIGTSEMIDQIIVTKYLQKKFGFIDTTRTGVWGWSFGGYAALKILEYDKDDVFKCAVAVAPCVDWALYDTMWSERYMRTFKENKKGYLDSSLLTNIISLQNKTFYIITGNADDNVHYQQPMLLTRALELNDILFEALSYPEEAHSLLGVRPHLYHSMDKFWKKCFNIKS